MTPQHFIAKWQRSTLSEQSACQQHFCDLCDVLEQPKPAEADPDGEWYTFEKGVKKTEGGDGWADVWMRGHFGWEYKGKHKDLKAAYAQLLLYREDLENPPLLVVCDMDRFEVHTNFTATAKRKYEFNLAALVEPANLAILRKLFTEPNALRPDIRTEAITRDAAERFGDLAQRLRMRDGVSAQRAAHFLMKVMFCMFGEQIGLLPAKLFGRLLETAKANPAMLTRRLESLFRAMAEGGDFGADVILRFNGGLFAENDAVPLTGPEINILASVNGYDWSNVEPSIFGTLFERHFDPSKESLVGAHYTSREDIVTLVEPVMMAAAAAGGIGTVRWPRTVHKDADCAESLQKRTLTNLYNQRPAWLQLAHEKLDEAVFAAYGWDPAISDEEVLERLLALNLSRARAKPAPGEKGAEPKLGRS